MSPSPSSFWFLDKPANQRSRLTWDTAAGPRHAKNICPLNPAHNSFGSRLGDLHLVLPSDPLDDFVWTWCSDCLVQDKVLHQLTTEGFTGFNPRPVHLRWERPSGQSLPILWEIEVTGWGGMAPVESGIRRIERCTACGRQVYTGFTNPEALFDEDEWDGNDFFMIWPMSRRIFITDRVSSFLRTHGLTGFEQSRLRQISFPKLVKTITPLPLRFQFPEDRARKLGEPLDIY